MRDHGEGKTKITSKKFIILNEVHIIILAIDRAMYGEHHRRQLQILEMSIREK